MYELTFEMPEPELVEFCPIIPGVSQELIWFYDLNRVLRQVIMLGALYDPKIESRWIIPDAE